jgi:hypothetical protein
MLDRALPRAVDEISNGGPFIWRLHRSLPIDIVSLYVSYVRGFPMFDVLMLILAFGAFALFLGYVTLCEIL